jgi:hypothetical protein
MTESRPLPDDSPEPSHGVNPGPNSAIDTYFSRVSRPTPEDMVRVANLIDSPHREIEHSQDTLNICEDLAKDVPNATTVLAGMINLGHEAIPKRWISDPEETRMVLSMVGHMELGSLRALKEAERRGNGFPGLSERILEIEQLIEDLH